MAPVPVETENNYNCGGDEGNNTMPFEGSTGMRTAVGREVPVKQSM